MHEVGWPRGIVVAALVPGVIGAAVTLLVLAGRAALERRPIAVNDVLSAVVVGVVLGAISAAVPFVLMRRVARNAAFADGSYEVPTRQSIERPAEERFQKFDDAARAVLTQAQNEAQRFNHNYIGTEHLLLGVLADADSTASRVLRSRGVELAKVREAVEFIVGRGNDEVRAEVGLTPRAKRVIELSIDEARRLGDGFIGSEHILLGLLAEGHGIAAGVLESLGVDLERLRTAVLRLRRAGGQAADA